MDFTRIEQRRNNIMNMARTQPCLKILGISLSYYNGKKWPRNFTERKNALYL